jgi:hypothetical protein
MMICTTGWRCSGSSTIWMYSIRTYWKQTKYWASNSWFVVHHNLPAHLLLVVKKYLTKYNVKHAYGQADSSVYTCVLFVHTLQRIESNYKSTFMLTEVCLNINTRGLW